MIIEDDNQDAYFYTTSKGDEDEALVVKDKLTMNGKIVFHFAVKTIQETVNKLLNKTNLTIDDIEKIIPHQANNRIIAAAANGLGIDYNLFYTNISHYENTSAASVIIALDEYLEENATLENKNIMLIAFGGGLTWGGALIRI